MPVNIRLVPSTAVASTGVSDGDSTHKLVAL
jgi:hypothetical protein